MTAPLEGDADQPSSVTVSCCLRRLLAATCSPYSVAVGELRESRESTKPSRSLSFSLSYNETKSLEEAPEILDLGGSLEYDNNRL